MPEPAPRPTRATLSADYQRDWPTYFDCVRDQPPRDTCVRALDVFEAEAASDASSHPLLAVDLACGEGRDTREILRRTSPRPWRVLAIDDSPAAEARFADAAPGAFSRVRFLRRSMEDVAARPAELAANLALLAADHDGPASGQATQVAPTQAGPFAAQVSLVNASFALPFCHEAAFPGLWAAIRGMLRPGGRFAGQFFGDRDDWAQINPRRHFSHAQILEVLEGFEVEWLDEVEKDGSDAMGGMKHHHVFHVVARTPRT